MAFQLVMPWTLPTMTHYVCIWFQFFFWKVFHVLPQATYLLYSTALISILFSLSRRSLSVHSTRLVLGNLAAWTHGACVVYASPSLDPPAIVDALIEEKCTALHGVPTHYLSVLEEVEKRNLWDRMGSLRSVSQKIVKHASC